MVASTFPTVFNRVAAKVVDLFVVVSLAALLPRVVGPLLGFAYSLVADGLNAGPFRGQSLGKKIFGLQAWNLIRQEPASLKDSVIRNAPVGVATFFSIIPIWGWIILPIVGLPLMLIEVYLMIRMEKGHRLGDVMADTEVRLYRKTSRARKSSSGTSGGASSESDSVLERDIEPKLEL